MAITSVVCNISMQSLVLRYGCAIGEFIDTPVHKGQRGVTMATNFGTKMAINAYKCISRRDNENAITYTGGFRGRPIQIRHFWLEGSKGRCHSNQILAKIGQKSQNGHNFSCMQHMHAEFGFEIGFVLSWNSSETLPYTRDKGALPWQPILGLKLL